MTKKELKCQTTLTIKHSAVKFFIDKALNEELGEMYEALNITSGDTISAIESAWNEHVNDLAHLFEQLIAYNLVVNDNIFLEIID